MTAIPLLSVALDAVAVGRPGGHRVPVIADVAFDLDRGESLAIVGESGSGKTLLALAIIGLLPEDARATGRVSLDGDDLLERREAEMDRVRGGRIGMIFQEPSTALNPAMRVADQIAEGRVVQRGEDWATARAAAVRLLDRVRLAGAARLAGSYPHEMSGGQRQRIGIAIALALEPALLIADEPTTALDVTVEADVLDLLDELRREDGMALIVVSHNLGLVARLAERTMVMYAGTRFEAGLTADLLAAPANPYTRGLIAAAPRRRSHPAERLPTIAGAPPDFTELPQGCRFADRCPRADAACRPDEPVWRAQAGARGVRCVHVGEEAR